MKKLNQMSWQFFLLLILANILSFLFSKKVGLYDPSLFRLQLEYPLLNLKPYVDFVFYYPLGLSLTSEIVHKLSFGMLNFSLLIWPIHFILQFVLIKKINEIVSLGHYKNLLLLFLLIETFFYGKLGTEPFSLIITFIVLIEAYLCQRNNKLTGLLFFFTLSLIFLRWDRFFYCLCIFLLYIFLSKAKKIILNNWAALKIISLFIACSVIFLGALAALNSQNYLESLNFIFLFPFKINKFRSLDFHFDNIIFTINNLFYLTLGLYVFSTIRLFLNKSVDSKAVFMFCMGLVMLPYCMVRPDSAHLVPFYLSTFFLLFFWDVTNFKPVEKFNVAINYYGVYIAFLFILGFSIHVLKEASKPIPNSCYQLKGIYKTIFVGNADYSKFVINVPLIYLNNLDLRPASRFVFEDPGVQNSCDYASAIVDELNRAEKPTIYYISATRKKEKYNSNQLETCGLLEKYFEQMTTKIGSCRIADYEFDVRLRN